jgi:hypothetical protein
MNLEEQREQLRPGAFLRIVNSEVGRRPYRGESVINCLHYLVIRKEVDMVEVSPVWRAIFGTPEFTARLSRGREGTWIAFWIAFGDPLLNHAVRIA